MVVLIGKLASPPPLEPPLRLTPYDLRRLQHLARDPKSDPSQIMAAKAVLEGAQGKTSEQTAFVLGVPAETVLNFRRRFARCRFAGLGDATSPSEVPLQAPNIASPSAVRIVLTGSEKRELARIARAHTSQQRMVLRAKIILFAHDGRNNCGIADKLGVSVKTVRKWRNRFNLHRREGLYDESRSGRPFTFGTAIRHEAFTTVVGPPPEPYARWNLDLLAKHLIDEGFVPSISLETISYWLRTADIKPHRVRGWLNSKDPKFREKRDRIVDLYLNPPKDGKVLSVDEKPSIQARERVRRERAVEPGQPRRMEWEYKRHGVVHLLASFDVGTGQIVQEFVDKANSAAFIRFLEKLMKVYPKGKLYLILDNGSTHCSRETKAFFAENERLVPVYTPTHASWLNQVEIWFSVMARHVIHHASFKSQEDLRNRIVAYIELHNRELAMPYEWSTKGKPLTGATAKARRRSRNTPRGSRRAARC